jgi:hypothetical protein
MPVEESRELAAAGRMSTILDAGDGYMGALGGRLCLLLVILVVTNR